MVVTETEEKAPETTDVDRPKSQRGKAGLDDPARKGGGFLLTPVVQRIFTREDFSDEQREIDSMVRDFALERIRPEHEALETHNEELSRKLLREVGELGLTGVDVPERYGGMELDKTTSAMVVEALTLCNSASWIVMFSAHVGIGTLPLVFFGTEEQKQKYLPRLASGELLAAYSLTEAESGSDALHPKATAVLSEDGSSYLLNGTKIWVTNGGWADLYTVFAMLDGKMSAFLMERGAEGFTIGPEEKKLGIKGSSTTTLILENARVPVENLLGKPGEGGAIALNVLNIGRFKLGAADLGACKSCTTIATEYALERRQFGQPIAFFEAIRKKLAEMVVRTYALDSVIYRTVGLMDERIAALDVESPDYNAGAMAALEEFAIENSIAKILGSESLFRISDQGIQVFGGNGFSEEYPLARLYRDTRIDRIFEGTNEINRMVIYGYYLKKSLMEELPLRDAEKTWLEAGPQEAAGLEWEVETLDAARRLTTKLLFEAISLYGQDLRNAQIVGEDLADLVIGYFAASSAINRLLQQGERATADRAHRALARLVVSTHLEEVWRIAYRLRAILLRGGYQRRLLPDIEGLMARFHLPFDPVEEIHCLTDDLYHHRRYRFE
jgi:alkylation response protein AidB-like acyl-CoA dehydrogenase